MAPFLIVALLCLAGCDREPTASPTHTAQRAAPPNINESGADPNVVKAVQAAREAVIASPDSAAAWGHMGLLLFVHQYPDEAAACLAAARELEPSNARWPYFQALNIINIDADVRRALPDLQAAAELAKDAWTPRLGLGDALLELGEVTEAAACFDTVLRAEPTNAWALAGAGQAAFAAGRLDDARRFLEESLRKAPGVKGTRLLLAQVHFRRGDSIAAERERDAARGLPDSHSWPDPWRSEAMKLVVGTAARIDEANRLHREGGSAQAIDVLEKVLIDQPEDYATLMALGRLQSATDDHAGAARSFANAAIVSPGAFEPHFALGIALHRMNRIAEAIASLQRAAELKPDYAPTHFTLAQCRILRGDQPGARVALRQTLRLQPDHVDAHTALGDTYIAAGDYAEARTHIEQALKLDPRNVEARKRLDFLDRQGRPGK